MRTFVAGRLELPVALALVAAACSGHLTVAPSIGPLGASLPENAGCPARVASVKNPTKGAVNVIVDRKVEGYLAPTLLGTVSAESTAEFTLTREYSSTLRFEWTSISEALNTIELNQVRYKVRCHVEGQDP